MAVQASQERGSRWGATLLAALLFLFLLPAGAGAEALEGPAVSRDPAVLLARESVSRRFIPSSADPRTDSVTGLQQEELVEEALAYFRRMRREEPERFARLLRMRSGEEGALSLYRRAGEEASRGDPLGAIYHWEQVAGLYPESKVADNALLHLASQQAVRGNYLAAVDAYGGVADLDLETSYDAELLLEGLFQRLEEQVLLARRRVPGGRFRLQDSLEDLNLDTTRAWTEWIDGYDRVNELAYKVGLETSGDVLRKVKNLGADNLTVDKLARLIPLDERKRAIASEEKALNPGATSEEMDVILRKRYKRGLKHTPNLALAQQLYIYLIADALQQMSLTRDGRHTARETVGRRTRLSQRVEGSDADRRGKPQAVARRERKAHRGLVRSPGRAGRWSWEPEDEEQRRALAVLFRLADTDADHRFSILRDDEGFWHPKRKAVEGDLVNAVHKNLDDDNRRPVEELYRAAGFSEQGFLAALVETCSTETGTIDPAAVEALVTGLLARTGAREEFRWEGWEPADSDLVGVREYIYRLNALRRPGEDLSVLLRSEFLEPEPAERTPLVQLARLDRRAGEIRAEMDGLGERHGNLVLFRADGEGLARDRFERALALDQELADIEVEMVQASLEEALIQDLEARGYHFTRRDRARVTQALRGEDLGSVAFLFDGANLDRIVGFKDFRKRFGANDQHSWVTGIGLDFMGLDPVAFTGYQGERPLRRVNLEYHIGMLGGAPGATDLEGVSVEWPTAKQNKIKVGLNASFLQGFGLWGRLHWTRDLTGRLRRQVEAVYAHLEEARGDRDLFVEMIFDPARDETAPIRNFLYSLGYTREAALTGDLAYQAVVDAYEFERHLRMATLNREAKRVRFGGLAFEAFLLGGELFLLLGPKIAVKDYRFLSTLVDDSNLEVESWEAYQRRAEVRAPLEPRGGRSVIHMASAELTVDGEGRPAVRLSDGVSREDWLAPGTPPTGMLASMKPSLSPPLPRPEVHQRDRINAMLDHGGSPLRLEEVPGESFHHALRLEGTSPHLSQTIRVYVEDDPKLGLYTARDGAPVLVAPKDLDDVNLEWFDLGRAVVHPGQAEQPYRLVVSRGRQATTYETVRGSGLFCRVDIVGGRMAGAALVGTGYRDDTGALILQENLFPDPDDPGLAGLESRLLAGEEDKRRAEARLLGDPLPSSGLALAGGGPAAGRLDPAFLESLRRTNRRDVQRFKRRNLSHYADPDPASPALDPLNVAYIQDRAREELGGPLEGDALLQAYFALSHQGLTRVDHLQPAIQVRALERRAGTSFRPGRGPFGPERIPPRTMEMLRKAGVDVEAALKEIRGGMEGMVREARASGSLTPGSLPAGTTILTDSELAGQRGVVAYRSTEEVGCHLIAGWGLDSNTGRFIALMGMAPFLPEIHREMLDRTGLRTDDPALHYETVFLPALFEALEDPVSDTWLRLPFPGGVRVNLAFDGPQHAGALHACKNGTLFPSSFRAEVEQVRERYVAAQPVSYVGFAESGLRLRGENWAGYRNLSLLGGAGITDDDGGGTKEEGGGDDGGGDDEPGTPPGPKGGQGRRGTDTPGTPGRTTPPGGGGEPPGTGPSPRGGTPDVPDVPDLPDRPVD